MNIESTENLLAHATAYYKELFGPVLGNLFQVPPNLWASHEILNAQDNEDLTRPFQIEEIKLALFSMKPNKALVLTIFL